MRSAQSLEARRSPPPRVGTSARRRPASARHQRPFREHAQPVLRALAAIAGPGPPMPLTLRIGGRDRGPGDVDGFVGVFGRLGGSWPVLSPGRVFRDYPFDLPDDGVEPADGVDFFEQLAVELGDFPGQSVRGKAPDRASTLRRAVRRAAVKDSRSGASETGVIAVRNISARGAGVHGQVRVDLLVGRFRALAGQDVFGADLDGLHSGRRSRERPVHRLTRCRCPLLLLIFGRRSND